MNLLAISITGGKLLNRWETVRSQNATVQHCVLSKRIPSLEIHGYKAMQIQPFKCRVNSNKNTTHRIRRATAQHEEAWHTVWRRGVLRAGDVTFAGRKQDTFNRFSRRKSQCIKSEYVATTSGIGIYSVLAFHWNWQRNACVDLKIRLSWLPCLLHRIFMHVLRSTLNNTVYHPMSVW